MLLTLLPNLQMGGSESAAATITLEENVAYEVYIKNRNDTWEHTRIIFTGTDFGAV
tara:strand:- start:554 stop:721 length:168 start_codon:yes stop_codon:yes gene_type:complete